MVLVLELGPSDEAVPSQVSFNDGAVFDELYSVVGLGHDYGERRLIMEAQLGSQSTLCSILCMSLHSQIHIHNQTHH